VAFINGRAEPEKKILAEETELLLADARTFDPTNPGIETTGSTQRGAASGAAVRAEVGAELGAASSKKKTQVNRKPRVCGAFA